MNKNNSKLLAILSIIISLISLLISAIVGITQIYYYIYNIKTDYSVRVRVLKGDPLEITQILFKNGKTPDDDINFITIGIPIEIYISNLSKRYLVIWRIEYEVIDNYNKILSFAQNTKLLKNLEYDKRRKKYINELNGNIKIEAENSNHCYGIIEIPYFNKDSKELYKIINKLKNKITLNNIVGSFSEEPLKLGVKINKIINNLILHKEINMNIKTMNMVKRTVLIKDMYRIQGDTLFVISDDKYYTDTGIEDYGIIGSGHIGRILEKMSKDKFENHNYEFSH